MNEIPITILTLIPLAGALALMGVDRERKGLIRSLGIACSLAALVMAGCLWLRFDAQAGGAQFVERHAWIPSIGVEYFVAVDGLGLLMVVLTALVVPFGLLAARREHQESKAFVALLLFLQSGLFGAFTALNFFHWFLFWELSLVPAYFLIKLWGGPGRVKAANQFFIYTMVGSVAMMLGFMAVFLATGSMDFLQLAAKARATEGGLTLSFSTALGWGGVSDANVASIVFLLVLAGFAVKVPLFPFHTWLPATYAEAPTSISMILTGVMSKMGVYGLLRILLPIFPEQIRAMQTPLLWLAVATVVLSAFAAMAQTDLKRMIAYSSINHLGYCLLGVFAAASLTGVGPSVATEQSAVLHGVMLQMFNHGITASALFCFIGFFEARNQGRRGLGDFGGLRQVAPVFCGLMGLTLFASLGLPGLNGFVGEFLIFKGAFPLAAWAAGLSVLGLLMTAVFLLTILQRVFSGPLAPAWSGFSDLTVKERLLVVPAVAVMLILGVYPQVVLSCLSPTVSALVQGLRS